MIEVDVLVIGAGFAGSLMALGLRAQGKRVALLESGRQPRFAIGESSTPLANLLLEELADRYNLPDVRAFAKWGTWQRTHPEVACGLKRGFTFLFHDPGSTFRDTSAHDRQLMVAASPHDEIADTHWYRAEFDHALVRQAEKAGAIYLDDTRVDSLVFEGGHACVGATRRGRALRVNADFVVDASGPRGCLHRALSLGEAPLAHFPGTEGLYTHFEDVDLWDRIVPPDAPPPYPADAAALHHVFPGGWIWILRFNNGVTSAGAALTTGLAAGIRAFEGDSAWARLLDRLPSVRRQFERARPTRPFVHVPRLSFRSARVTGPGWALLPSAAGFIDPLLSTGFALTLLGVHRLLDVLERPASNAEREGMLEAYARTTATELDVTEGLIAALYATMDDPALFKRLTLLYFAAVSYAETARRLRRPERAPGFLLHDHEQFGPGFLACTALGRRAPRGHERLGLMERIDRLIEPFDVAGLGDRTRRDWYPARAEDLLASRGKLAADVDAIYGMLARSGFAATAGDRLSHQISAASAGGPTRNSA